MKFMGLILVSAIATSASADNLSELVGRAEFKKINTLRCYLDENNNGRLSKDEILIKADPESQTLLDYREKTSYRVTSAHVRKLPNGRVAGLSIQATALNVRFAGGGRKTITILTDYLVRRRWNSVVEVKTTNLYRPRHDSAMMDCDLGAER